MTAASRTYAIHPAIGIARMGDLALDPGNPNTFYLGAEAPYEVPNDRRKYKAGGKIRKQAQRFRIYEYENGVAVREITLEEGDVETIEWTVHLANRKAALNPDRPGCPLSTPGVAPATYEPAKARNAEVGDSGSDTRGSLVIDPGAASVHAGRDSADGLRTLSGSISFSDGGKPVAAEVTLGSIAAEPATGRLLVFAADGISRGVANGVFTDSAEFGSPRSAKKPDWIYANSDCWYDDTADGRVRARITFKNGSTIDLSQPEQAAWVICTMPRYAPGLGYFTTLHDVALDACPPQEGPGRQPSFMADIYPILASVSQLHWVNVTAADGHSPGKGGNYAGEMEALADNDTSTSSATYKQRQEIFGRLRKPGAVDRCKRLMPRLSDDVLADKDEKKNFDVPALTERQYAMLEKWSIGDFRNDFDGRAPYRPLDDRPVADQPAALDRGALDGTAGTPLYPGIESWKIMREPAVYAAPLRISDRMRPGDLTMGNALPWQADFLDCTGTWWPVQRPTNVIRGGSYQSWVPNSWGEENDIPNFAEMVKHWAGLGFVLGDAGTGFAEDERTLGDDG